MNRKQILLYWQITNVVLIIIALLLMVIAGTLSKDKNRYVLKVLDAAKEIYVFDQQTGKLFITTPEITADYNKEIWTEFNPLKQGNALSIKEMLNDKAGSEMRKRFLNEVRRLRPQEEKK